jgi:hypothetical protein
MLDFVYALPTVVQAALIVGVMIVASLAGLLLTRNLASPDLLRASHDVTGFIYGAVAVLYAVLLAFAAVIVWQDADQAAETFNREENLIGDLYRDAGLLPAEFSKPFQTRLKAYVTALVEDEWPQMQRGKRSEKTSELLHELFVDFAAFEPATKRDQTIYAESLRVMNQVLDHRRMRLAAAETGLQPVVWSIMILGAAITIAFTYQFALGSIVMQGVMTAALGASVGLIFFLIVALDYPFRGDVAIGSGRLQDLLHLWAAAAG